MTSRDSIDWDFGNAPKQSITEVLQDPRAPALELPDISNIDLSAATALSLTPVPPVNLPPPANINHFESYLRRYAPLIDAFRTSQADAHAAPTDAPDVPAHFFDPSFTLADHPQFAALQHDTSASTDTPLSAHPDLPALRDSLRTHRATLEHRLTAVLDEQSVRLDTALDNIRTLRQHLLDTAATMRRTREQTAALVPSVAAPIAATHSLTHLRHNLEILIFAAREVAIVRRAPDDVATLLAAGAYLPAIDAVSAARDALTAPRLSGVQAIFPVRRALAASVEEIDAALRADFRAALAESSSEPDSAGSALRDVVAMVHRMGRLALLVRFFVREISDALDAELSTVSSLSLAASHVRAAAEKVLLVLRVARKDLDAPSTAQCDESLPEPAEKQAGVVPLEARYNEDDQEILKTALSEFEQMVAGVVDRLWGSFGGLVGAGASASSPYLVITPDKELTDVSCFDEFKAAFKFGEQIRSLEELASELERTFDLVKKKGVLRAKISEKQIAFVSAFHKSHVDVISAAVRSDKWQEMPVPSSAAKLLTAVFHESQTANSNTEEENGRDAKATDPAPERRKSDEGMVFINGKGYKTVACGVRYLRSVCAYTLISEQSAILAPEVARRATELSRLFNSLTWKAILGAEALQWSGLRSITARHLSLASRTISMAGALVQQVNVPLEKALLPSQAGVISPLMSRCEKDLHDHHAQLLAKILAIMMDRLGAHEEVLRSLPWDKQMEMQRFKVPSAYVVTLSKETMLLHRILWAVLPKNEACDIFTRVWAAYGTHLSDAYGSLDGGKKWVRSRVATDVASLYDKLKGLELAKEFPSAIRPISQLYVRFSKDELEAQEKKAKHGTQKSTSTQKDEPVDKEEKAATVVPSGTEDRKKREVDTAQMNGKAEKLPSADGSQTDKVATTLPPSSNGSQTGVRDSKTAQTEVRDPASAGVNASQGEVDQPSSSAGTEDMKNTASTEEVPNEPSDADKLTAMETNAAGDAVSETVDGPNASSSSLQQDEKSEENDSTPQAPTATAEYQRDPTVVETDQPFTKGLPMNMESAGDIKEPTSTSTEQVSSKASMQSAGDIKEPTSTSTEQVSSKAPMPSDTDTPAEPDKVSEDQPSGCEGSDIAPSSGQSSSANPSESDLDNRKAAS